MGRPEPQKHGFSGYWSRRITDEHRLIYKIVEGEIRLPPADITPAANSSADFLFAGLG